MEQLKKMLKEYADGLTVPASVTPECVKAEIEKHHLSAGMFLKKLREMRVSGADFLELLGNSKIDNIEYRRIEQNPHLKYDDLRRILENSCLESEDYAAMIEAASHPGKAVKQEIKTPISKPVQPVQTEQPEKPVQSVQIEQPENPVQPVQTEQPEKSVQQAEPIEPVPPIKSEEPSERDELSNKKLAAAQAIIDRVISGQADEQDAAAKIVNELYKSEEPQEAYFSQPDKPKEVEEELYFGDEQLNDSDDVEPTAEGIADALNELVDNNPSEEPPCKRSRGALIASFVCAGLLTLGGLGLKAMYHYGIIPEYIYKLPDIIDQKITDFTSLVTEAKDAEGKVSYNLPEFFGCEKQCEIVAQHSACGENSTVSIVDDNENGWILSGIEFSKGKIKNEFSFEPELSNPTIAFLNGNYVIAGKGENGATVKVYNETALSDGEAILEAVQSGNFEACFTDGEYIYTVTSQAFELDKAAETNLRSFVPTFTLNSSETVVPLGNILLPKTVNRLNYITVSAISIDGDSKVKSILVGDAGGFYISKNGVYAVDNTVINDRASMRIFCIDTNKDLTSRYIDTDGAADGWSIRGFDNGVAVYGAVFTEATSESGESVTDIEPAIYSFARSDGGISVMTKLPIKEKIASAYCVGDVYSFTEQGSEGLTYSVNVTDMTPAELPKPQSDKTTVNEEIYITAKQETKGDICKGIKLTVFNNGEKSAEAVVKPNSGDEAVWGKYLSSPIVQNSEEIPYYYNGEAMIIGIPIIYFDGVTTVSEYVFCKYDGKDIKTLGRITLYDNKYESISCRILGGDKPYIVTVWDNRIVTADIEKVKIITDKTQEG